MFCYDTLTKTWYFFVVTNRSQKYQYLSSNVLYFLSQKTLSTHFSYPTGSDCLLYLYFAVQTVQYGPCTCHVHVHCELGLSTMRDFNIGCIKQHCYLLKQRNLQIQYSMFSHGLAAQVFDPQSFFHPKIMFTGILCCYRCLEFEFKQRL